jgi:hypothetical protein
MLEFQKNKIFARFCQSYLPQSASHPSECETYQLQLPSSLSVETLSQEGHAAYAADSCALNTTDVQKSHESSSKGMPAQKASRTKNPIADKKPASKAMSSIDSIQRTEGIFFIALICVDQASEKLHSVASLSVSEDATVALNLVTGLQIETASIV